MATTLSLGLGPAVLATAPERTEGPELMVDAINHARARHGLAPLRGDPALCRSSVGFARHLIATEVFGHAASIRASGIFRRLGEVIAMHRGPEAQRGRTVRRWLGSPSHRALILTSRFRFAGAGRAAGRFGGVPTTIWVVQLGTR